MKLLNTLLETKMITNSEEINRLFHQGKIKIDGEIIKNLDIYVSDGTHVVGIEKKEIRITMNQGYLLEYYPVLK